MVGAVQGAARPGSRSTRREDEQEEAHAQGPCSLEDVGQSLEYGVTRSYQRSHFSRKSKKGFEERAQDLQILNPL